MVGAAISGLSSCAPETNFIQGPMENEAAVETSESAISKLPDKSPEPSGTTSSSPEPTGLKTTPKLKLRVVNATTNRPIPKAKLKMKATNVVHDSDDNGEHNFANRPNRGTQIETSSPGFVAQTREVDEASPEMVVALSPELKSGEMRIVLSWGATPRDLDSYLLAYPTGQSSYRIHFRFKARLPEAKLDVDATNGKGPETITLTGLSAGRYVYRVYDYTNKNSATPALLNPEIKTSNAVVTFYQPGKDPVSFQPPGNVPNDLTWNVFSFEIDSAGKITVTTQGTLTNNESLLH